MCRGEDVKMYSADVFLRRTIRRRSREKQTHTLTLLKLVSNMRTNERQKNAYKKNTERQPVTQRDFLPPSKHKRMRRSWQYFVLQCGRTLNIFQSDNKPTLEAKQQNDSRHKTWQHDSAQCTTLLLFRYPWTLERYHRTLFKQEQALPQQACGTCRQQALTTTTTTTTTTTMACSLIDSLASCHHRECCYHARRSTKITFTKVTALQCFDTRHSAW